MSQHSNQSTERKTTNLCLTAVVVCSPAVPVTGAEIKDNNQQQRSPATSRYRWTPRTSIAGITSFPYQNVATYPTTTSPTTTTLCTLHSPDSTSFHPRSSQGHPASTSTSTTTAISTTSTSAAINSRGWVHCTASSYGRLDKRLGSSCKNGRIEVRSLSMFHLSHHSQIDYNVSENMHLHCNYIPLISYLLMLL